MEPNNVNRAEESRPASGSVGHPIASDPSQPTQPVPRPPLNRADSRSSLSALSPLPPRPAGPPPNRPQFQPGGSVTTPPQFVPRSGAPQPRGSIPSNPLGTPLTRPQPPLVRPLGPPPISSQPIPRPLQSPTAGQPPQRGPPPNNLQFGPRQPPQFGSASTPDGARPLTAQPNGAPRNGVPLATGQLPRQSSQGSLRVSDLNTPQNKPGNLDNLNTSPENKDEYKSENGIEPQGTPKGRSYSIAAAPGSPSPFKMEDDRRKSVSSIGGKIEEFASRSPGLGLIQEGKTSSSDLIRGSKESVKLEASNESSRDTPDRPESRLTGSKMTESFIGSLPMSTQKKKTDDDDDVILQNNSNLAKKLLEATQEQTKPDLSDRSPSLTQSDDSPEPKTKPAQIPALSTKVPSQCATPEPQRPKTPKIDVKQEIMSEPNKDMQPIIQSSIKTPTKTPTKSPVSEIKPSTPRNKKPNDLHTPRKSASAPKVRPKDGDNDSGVDESTQGNDLNGSPSSPAKKTPSKLPTKEKSSGSMKMSLSRSSSKSATAKTPETPLPTEKKKVPMNKVQVGNAPSPNIKTVKSKIGSLDNATYKPGGGKVKIENRKLEFGNVTPKIAAKNDAYVPSGGSKKITTTKLEWNAKPKVGSLQNTAYKPGGGDKKIETVKLDFKDKAKPKVASTVNITHKPGGGTIKLSMSKDGSRAIENHKLDYKVQSKVGSLDNVKHKPGGGDIKIFDDKDYIKQVSGQSPVPSNQSRQEENYYMDQDLLEDDRPFSRTRSARGPRTPRTPRALSPRKQVCEEDSLVRRNNERNRRMSLARPASARDPPRSACSKNGSMTSRPAFSVY